MVLNCKVTIGNLIFTALADIEVKKSWKMFTDTAKIRIPRDLYFYENGSLTKVTKPIQKVIKPNDSIKIELGYDRTLVTEFEGYVARAPKATYPYEIECEDEMFILKQKEVTVEIENATLRQVLEKAAPDYVIDCVDEVIGDFSMSNVTPLEVFNELKKRHSIYTFFRGDRLVSGLVYSDPKLPETVANYKMGVNIIQNDLQYQNAEDVKLKIYASSKQLDGTVIKVEIGENGGNIKRKRYNVALSRSVLLKALNREYEMHKSAGGYDGEIKSFGYPFVEHGQTIRIADDIYEQRDSKHFVDEVNVAFSPTIGYRRTLKPTKTI